MEREKPPPLVVDYIDLASFEPQTRRQPESALALLPRFIEWVDKHGGRFIPLRKRSLHPTHKNFAHHGLLSVGEVLARDIEKTETSAWCPGRASWSSTSTPPRPCDVCGRCWTPATSWAC